MHALLLSALLAGLGWRLRALTAGAAATAILIGTIILAATGWAGMAALGAFFVGSSAIGRVAPDHTAARGAKGQQRDPWQVLANGGPAALGALLPEAGLWLVTASLAAAAADTWATATGGWSRRPPRNIVTGALVPPGSSGGVTWPGSLGGAVGAWSVGAAVALFAPEWRSLLIAALGIGVAGMLLDSLLGATLQGRFRCDGCGQDTERPVHRCGQMARRTGGLPWLTNDGVNALATGAAAGLGWVAWRMLGPGSAP